MTRLAVRAFLALTNRAAGITVLTALALIHPLIHATFLDGGSLDAAFAGLQAWAITNLHTGSD